MITFYDIAGKGIAKREGSGQLREETVWIDLVDPSREEDEAMEAALGIQVPTRAEMREIEPSNRHYKENGAHYMTAFIIYNIEQPRPDTGTFTFILVGKRLVTVRYGETKSFPMYLSRVEKGDASCGNGAEILIGLIEAIISREADLIERIQDEVDRLTQSIFDIKGGQQTRHRRLDVTLRSVGKEGDITSRAQEAAFSLERVLMFFHAAAQERGDDASVLQRILAAKSDTATLSQHAQFLASRTTFMLEATLGMINTEQNQIIKLFSVVAVMLMPPTLVASVYGMNFRHMPELGWELGYPMALVMMLLSAVLPYIYFRHRGWL